ncbi:MAG: SDR family NAD(P)-dependent oxidoreductase, partial [Euryarchaeota archaeon]|nr:SDR family NAD(P)-dependent oxidoreductase [Euryarchaeota archaeon]
MKAIITGGSSGLGFQFARELKKRGCDIVLVSRNEEKLKNAASELGGAEYHAIDLAKEYRKMDNIIRDTAPEIVINNAGFGLYGKFATQNPERIEEMLRLNIIALTRITRLALEHMENGYILNVSSVAACRPSPGLAAYAGTKAYVEHFTKSLKKEMNNVHVSYLLLGPTRTNFFKNANMDSSKLERIMLEPEKVAAYAVKKMLK